MRARTHLNTIPEGSPLSRLAKAYAYLVVGAGTVAIASSLTELSVGSVPSQWILLAALALFSGVFATKIPSLDATVSVTEALTLALATLLGPAPAIATAAVDGLIASARVRRWSVYRTLFDVAAPALCVWCGAIVFYRLSGVEPLLFGGDVAFFPLVIPMLALAATYYALRSLLSAAWTRVESGASGIEFLKNRRYDLFLNYSVTVVVLAVLLRSASTFWTFAICASGVVLALIGLSHTFSKTYIAHVESTNLHLAALNELYFSTIETLATAIDAKDQVTSGHTRRVQQSTLELALKLGVNDPDEIKAIEGGSLLHDLGKLVVPEHILNKPGSLSGNEFDEMKRHASIGADILAKVGFPYPVEPIVRHHHENWDGSGYPDGLRGKDIPLGARILSVVDCFDALTSDRPYRRELSCDVALDIIRARRGSMYDPEVVDAFLEHYSDLAVSRKLMNGQAPVTAAEPGPNPTPELSNVSDCELDRRSRVLARFADELRRQSAPLPGDALLVIYRRDPSTDRLRAYGVSDATRSWIRRVSIKIGDGVAGWVAANDRRVVNADPLPDFDGLASQAREFRSCVSVPVQWVGQSVGVVSIYSSHQSAFSERSRALAESLAEEIAPELHPSAPRSSSAPVRANLVLDQALT